MCVPFRTYKIHSKVIENRVGIKFERKYGELGQLSIGKVVGMFLNRILCLHEVLYSLIVIFGTLIA